jgi:hypothetical protein
LHPGDVGAAESADLAPFAGEGPVVGKAVGEVPDIERVKIGVVVLLDDVELPLTMNAGLGLPAGMSS